MEASINDRLWVLMSNHELEIEGRIPGDVICVICGKLSIKPYNGPCKCNFCYSCIQQYLQSGTNRVCPGNSERCGDTTLDFENNIVENVTVHADIGKVLVKCPNSLCQMILELQQIERHLQVCTMVCPYVAIGCDSSTKINGTIKYHLNSEILFHSRILMDAINNLQNDVDNLTRVIDRREITISDQQQQIDRLISDKNATETRIQELSEHMDNNKLELEGCKLEIEELINKEVLHDAESRRHGDRVADLLEMMEKNGVSVEKIKESECQNRIDMNEIIDSCNSQMKEFERKFEEKFQKAEDQLSLANDEQIKYKKLIGIEIEQQKLKTEELRVNAATEIKEFRKGVWENTIKVNEMRASIGKMDEVLKLEQESHFRELEALTKYKKEIRMEIERHKSKLEDLQKECKTNKTKIEKVKKTEVKSNISDELSLHVASISGIKYEQERLTKELQELRQDQVQVKVNSEKQKNTINELKKKEDNTANVMTDLIHKCDANNMLPHILMGQAMGQIQGLKKVMVELETFKELKRQVLKNVKGISDVTNALKECHQSISATVNEKADPDLPFDFVWTLWDFSEKKKQSEYLSDPFYRGRYKLCLNIRLDGYNMCLALCVMSGDGSRSSDWSEENEFVLGIINQLTLKPHSYERLTYTKSRNKSLGKRCSSNIRLCIGGPCIPLADVVTTPGLLRNDSVMVYFSLPRNPK